MQTQYSHFSLVRVSSKFRTSPYRLQLSSAWQSKVQFWTFTLTNSQLSVNFHNSSCFSSKIHQWSTSFFKKTNITDSIFSLQRHSYSSFLFSQGARITKFFIHMLSAWLGTQRTVSQEQDWMAFLDSVSLWIVVARRLQSLPSDIVNSIIWDFTIWTLETSGKFRKCLRQEWPFSMPNLTKLMHITCLIN